MKYLCKNFILKACRKRDINKLNEMLSWDFWIECRIYIELELRYSKVINYLIRLASKTFFINKNLFFFVKVCTYWCLLLCGQYFIDWHYVSEYYCATDDGRFIVDYVLVTNIIFWFVRRLYPGPMAIVLQSHESKGKFTNNYVDYVKCRRYLCKLVFRVWSEVRTPSSIYNFKFIFYF